MLLPKSICVFIPCYKSVAPRVCMAKVPFLFRFLGGPDMDTEMGWSYRCTIPQITLIPNIYGFMV